MERTESALALAVGAVFDNQRADNAGAVYTFGVLTELPALTIDRQAERATISWPSTPGFAWALQQSPSSG